MQSRTAASDVVARLRGRILSGGLRPGTALPPERTLASELAVSRSTLREGLSILSHMGLVTIQRGRSGGAIVTQPPAATVSASILLLWQTKVITAGQLCEFRRALEVEAVQLAAARATPADLVSIASALQAYATPGLTSAQQNVHGRAFHQAVAHASGNPLLAETMVSLNDAFAASFSLLHAQPDPVDLILSLHLPILNAITARDIASARIAMIAHFDQLADSLLELGLTTCLLAATDTTKSPPGNAFSIVSTPSSSVPDILKPSPRAPRPHTSGHGKEVASTPHS